MPSRRSITPWKLPGMPTGQVSGTSGSPSVSVRWSTISERLHAGAVVLVHEREQRDPARAGDLEQLLGLRLHAARRVDQDHGRVDRGQHAQRVLGEVLVPGRVEQVEDDVVVLEAQHRRGDRDPAPLLELHPVRGRRLPARARAVTDPASPTAPAYSSSFSVRVVLPASGCEMIAKVRRRAASCNNCVSAAVLIGHPGYEGRAGVLMR